MLNFQDKFLDANKNYYSECIDERIAWCEFGAAEILAFSLQSQALGLEFDKERELDVKEANVLMSIINSFQKQVSIKHPEMSSLINLCKKFCSELHKRVIINAGIKEKDEGKAITKGKKLEESVESTHAVLGKFTRQVIEQEVDSKESEQEK